MICTHIQSKDFEKNMASLHHARNIKWMEAVAQMKNAREAYNARWKSILPLRVEAQKRLKAVCVAELDMEIIGDDEVRRPILDAAKKRWKEAGDEVRKAIQVETVALIKARQEAKKAYVELHN